jgi:hypothetical protein
MPQSYVANITGIKPNVSPQTLSETKMPIFLGPIVPSSVWIVAEGAIAERPISGRFPSSHR